MDTLISVSLGRMNKNKFHAVLAMLLSAMFSVLVIAWLLI